MTKHSALNGRRDGVSGKLKAEAAAPIPASSVVVSAAGELRILLPYDSVEAAPEALALVLDGSIRGVLRNAGAEADSIVFEGALPAQAIFGQLDMLSSLNNRSVLPRPFSLREYFGFTLTKLTIQNGRVLGRFTLARPMGRYLSAELLSGNEFAARALAVQANAAPDAPSAEYAFDAPMLWLIPIGQARRLVLRIAGYVLPDLTLDITADDVGFGGFLDHGAERLEGWVLNMRQPKRRIAVDLLVDGVLLRTVTADGMRKDIRAAGFGDGWCGFSVDLPPEDGRGKMRLVSAVISGTPTQLCNSPVTIQPTPTLQGYFDNVHGMSAFGWAFDSRHPDTPVVVEAVAMDGRVLGSAEARLFRGDFLNAGLADGMCAFKIDLGAHFMALVGHEILVRVAGTGSVLQGSPKRVTVNPNLLRFLQRRDLPPALTMRLRRRFDHQAGGLAISIIMPVYNPPAAWLIEAIESVLAQWCSRWELICVNDCSTEPHVAQILALASRRDARIRVLNCPQNVGIAAATNFGLRAARHPYTAFMDHDDTIEPDAVWQLIRAAKQTDADFLYSDEAVTDETINGVSEVRARPAFSYDYYLSHPYFVHMLCVRTSIARSINGWDEGMAISADVDFVLRVLEQARNVVHVPAVLYRWRTHSKSTGHQSQARVMDATRGALQRHLDRTGANARVSDGVWYNQFRVDWPASDGEILIVIPTKNKPNLLRTAINSIVATSKGVNYRIVVIDHQSDEPTARRYLKQVAKAHTVMPYAGPFNYSRMNNMAVETHGAGAEFVLFLNNDVEAVQPGWLDRMRRLAARREVGAVGALLLYADKRVQHAGVIFGFNGSADHALKFSDAFLDTKDTRSLGYNCSLTSVRDFSAVTAACLMTRREVFEAADGFDETFAVGFNDTDLCLRLRKAGYKVLYDGSTMLYHYESATRSETKQVLHPEDTARLLDRCKDILRDGDPFYNPILSDHIQDHVLREDAGCRTAHTPRVTAINLLRRPDAPRPRKARVAKAAQARSFQEGEPVA